MQKFLKVFVLALGATFFIGTAFWHIYYSTKIKKLSDTVEAQHDTIYELELRLGHYECAVELLNESDSTAAAAFSKALSNTE